LTTNSAQTTHRQAGEPTTAELHILTICACAVLAAVIQAADRTHGFWQFDAADTPSYAVITWAIRTGNLHALSEVKLFWGVAYVAAAVSSLAPVTDTAAVLLVSFCACLASVALANHLWGGWIAAVFAIISWDWLVASTLGGSETLFVALLFTAFLASRHKRWLLAALAASGSMTVRPAGVLALAAIIAVLVSRRDWRSAAAAGLIGLAIAFAYTLPLRLVRGEGFGYFESYRRDWIGGFPIGLPFAALAQGLHAATRPIEIVRPAAWIVSILAAAVAFAVRARPRAYAATWQVETIFAVLYLCVLFTYNAARWAWLEFPRFAIPLIPFALVAVESALPKKRWVIWIAAPVSGLLSAAWLLGFHNVWRAVAAP
jgi:hypothetical protein